MRLRLPKNNYSQLFLELGLVWLFLFLCRVIFLVKNQIFFPDFGIYEYVVGSWFDLITIALFFLPYILLCTVPVSGIFDKYRQVIASIVYVPSVVTVFFFNTLDIAYFSYTRKRIS